MPPAASTRILQLARPMPIPDVALSSALTSEMTEEFRFSRVSSDLKAMKRFFIFLYGIPMPLSITLVVRRLALESKLSCTVISPPSLLNLMAFWKRKKRISV